jgi:hypothetical protein
MLQVFRDRLKAYLRLSAIDNPTNTPSKKLIQSVEGKNFHIKRAMTKNPDPR